MKLTINRKQFSDHLQSAFAVASKAQKDVLGSVKLIAVPDGYDLHASNGELGLIVKGEPIQRTDGQCLLPNRVLSILRESNEEDLTIEATDREVLIYGDSARFSLPSQDPAEFPSVKELDEGVQFDLACDAVRRIASQVGYAVDETSTRYQLGGVLFSVGEDRIDAVATDGRRMARLALDTTCDKTASGIVPSKALRTVTSALGDGVCTITLASNKAMFRSDSASLVVPLVEGRYPNWQTVIPADADPVRILAGPWFSVVKQASVVAPDDSRGITMSIKNGTLSMSARTADIGSSQVSMPVADGIEIETTVDWRFLADVLRSIEPTQTVDLHFAGSGRPVKLVAGQLTAVIMPMEKR